MADFLLVLATAAFFALSWGYVRLCEEALMSLEYGIGLALSVLLLVYLSWALLKPEHF